MTQIGVAVCNWCKHFDHNRDFTCKAFPDGIPKDIRDGRNAHLRPVDGDGGIQYTPVTKE